MKRFIDATNDYTSYDEQRDAYFTKQNHFKFDIEAYEAEKVEKEIKELIDMAKSALVIVLTLIFMWYIITHPFKTW